MKCPACAADIAIPEFPTAQDDPVSNARPGQRMFHDMADQLREIPPGAPARLTRSSLGRLRLHKLLRLIGKSEGRSSAEREKRCAAVAELGGSRDERAVDLLIRLATAEDERPPIREAAVKALGECGDPRAVPLLVSLLDLPASALREAAVAALGNTGDRRAVRPLIHFGMEHPHTKYLTTDAILRLEEEAAVELLDVLNDREPGVVLEAVVLLGRLKNPRAVPAVIQILETRSALFRSHAAEALGQIGDRRAVTALLPLLSDADPSVRINAAAALEKLPDPNSVKRLVTLLADEDEDVRIQAIHALGAIGDNRAAEPLCQALADAPPMIQVAAAEALGQCGDQRAVAPLLKMIQSPDESLKLKAISALRRIKDPKAAAALLDLLHHESEAVRQRVVDTLGHLGDAEVANRLETVLKFDRSEVVRVAAAKALGEIRDPASVAALMDALDDEFTVRCRAVVSLGMIGDESAVPAVLAMLRNPVPEIRYHAAGALAELAPPNAIAQLRALADDSNAMVRRGVVKALQKLGDPDAEQLAGDSVRLRLRRARKRAASAAAEVAAAVLPGWLVSVLWPNSRKGKAVAGGVIAALAVAAVLLVSGTFTGVGPGGVVIRGRTADVALSRDGSQLATARTHALVELWDAGGGLRTQVRMAALRVVFAADNQTLAVVQSDGIRIWNTATDPSPGKLFAGHAAPIASAAQSPDRDWLATIDSAAVAVCWSLPGGEAKYSLQLPEGTRPSPLAVSAGGRLLATVEKSGDISVWEVAGPSQVAQISGPKLGVTALAFSPDGASLAGCVSGQILIWKVQNGELAKTVDVPATGTRIAFTLDGQSLLCFSGTTVQVVAIEAGSIQTIDVGDADELGSLSLAEEAGRVAVGGTENSAMWVLDLAAGNVLRTLDVD